MTRRGQKEATRELLEAEDLSPPSLPLVLIALFFRSRGVSVSEKTAQSRKKKLEVEKERTADCTRLFVSLVTSARARIPIHHASDDTNL